MACVPSGGALLAKVYGVASMQAVTLAVALPCCVALAGIWIWADRSGRKELAAALTIGLAGGFLGTVAYDVIRLPFLAAGQRVFAPISAYGVWIAEASSSSRFTEVIGWLYHFSNGITFGIMYALFMRNRHWALAIAWAFVLETIAILSPFAPIFSLSGNYAALGIAYLGHVAYGVPLGWLVYRWKNMKLPNWLRWTAILLGCAAIAGPLVSPEAIERDGRAAEGEFRVEGERLNPDWLRIERGGKVRVHNPGAEYVKVRVRQNDMTIDVSAGKKDTLSFAAPGIYQVFIETERRSRSSFVIVEPVEEFQGWSRRPPGPEAIL
jgi:hypothetical protein